MLAYNKQCGVENRSYLAQQNVPSGSPRLFSFGLSLYPLFAYRLP